MSIECAECERDLRGGHDQSCSRYKPPAKGSTGLIRTHHKSDEPYSARARVIWANRRQIKVELLEPFYCLDKGDQLRTATRLFVEAK